MSNDSQKGQSLMEILIGLGIISIMIGVSTYALVTVLRSSTITEQNQAAGLIENSLLESVSTLAEADWNKIYNLSKSESYHYYLVRSSTTTPTPVSGDESVLEQDITNGLVGYWKMDETSGTTAYDSSGTGNSGTLTNMPNINSGLVGHWKFDESSGVAAIDASGSNNNGTLTNSPTRMEPASCKLGSCLSFDGTDDYINYANSGSLNNLDKFTLSAWIYMDARKYIPTIIIKGPEDKVQHIWWGVNSNNRIWFELGDSSSYTSYNSDALSWTLGKWYYLAVTFDNTSKQVSHYRDGQLINTVSTAGREFNSGTYEMNIGQYRNGYAPTSYHFDGLMDDVRMYNRVLSASEISRLYNTNACKVGSCLAFDGTSQYVNLGSNSSMNQNVFTLTAWIKPASVTSGTIFGGFRTNGDTKNFIRLNNGKVGIDQYPPSGGFINSNTTLIANNWYHVAAIQNGSYWAVYVNGVLDNSNSSAETYAGGVPTQWNIGRRELTGNEGYYSGLIDDVRIYNRALSASEISQLYNSPVYLRYFYVDNIKRTVCGTGDITDDAESACIGTSGVSEDPATQKITVGTYWNLRGVQHILENYIYVTRWLNSAASQKDWSGSSGAEQPVIDFSSDYSSATNVQVTASGTIKIMGL